MRKTDHATFGTGGNSDSFYASRKKSTVQAPEWIKAFGLDAYEFEAGNGLNAGDETLKKNRRCRSRAWNSDVLSHTVFYIPLGNRPRKAP